MAWKSIDVICQNDSCDYCWGEIVDKVDQDKDFECPKCKSLAKRGIRTIHNLKASYPDGHYRMDGIGKMMDMDKLETAFAAAEDRNDRDGGMDIAKEIMAKGEER